MSSQISRRHFLQSTAAIAGAVAYPNLAFAKGSVSSAIYPGAWDEAYRKIVAPALKKSAGVDLELQPLFAVDQIAKAKAARGRPVFDTFVLDPGPSATGKADNLFEKFDGNQLKNSSALQAGLLDAYGVPIAAQFVGIAYNPKKISKPPTKWTDLFQEPYLSRLGLTGFQTTFGTVAIIEFSKAFGGSITNVDPFFVELKKVLKKVAVIGAPAAMPGLFQQGQCDVMYANTQTVGILKSRGVDIEFVAPESGIATFFTTMHIAKGSEDIANAYKYIDTVLSTEVQTQLMKPPYFMAPVNSKVALDDSLPVKNLSEMSKMIQHDWTKINPLRAEWITRFNKEVS